MDDELDIHGPDPIIGVAVAPTTASGGVVAPTVMTAEEIDDAHRLALELVHSIRETTGARQMAVLDEVANVGLRSQRNAGRQLELVSARLSTFLDEGGSSKNVASDLVDLRTALDRINPDSGNRGVLSRIGRSIPFIRHRSVVRALNRIALRYEPVSKQITVIETRLTQGRAMLVRDNVELRQLYEDIETQQAAIQRQTFLGEVLLAHLNEMIEEITDPIERDRVGGALHDIAVRVQDLHTMQEVHAQYFVSIELTRQNNHRLGNAVDRTVSLATNVVTVGLALQAALVRQRNVKEATERTREFLGEMITQNAAAIRRQTEDIGDLYNDPVIAMDKLEQAHRDLLAALDEASRVRDQGLATARTNIDQLKTITAELSEHVQGIEDDQSRVYR